MLIRVYRTSEVSNSIYREIMHHLRGVAGPIQYASSYYTEDWNKAPAKFRDGVRCLSAGQVWEKCRSYRQANNVSDDVAVVLLTEYPTDENWFSAGESGGTRNFFINASGRDALDEASDPKYPVIHELACIPLAVAGYPDYAGVLKASHDMPAGCCLDHCKSMGDIDLKMRTADICQTCQAYLVAAGVTPALLRQVFAVMEDVRSRLLFRERFEMLAEPSEMVVNEQRMTLMFTSVKPVPVKLTPQEMTVYLFFLNHPGGVYFIRLADYRAELLKMYMRLSDKAELDTLQKSVDNMIANTRKILNPVITKINNKITKAVGDRIDKYYQVIGGGKKHRIAIDRKYVKRVNLVTADLRIESF